MQILYFVMYFMIAGAVNNAPINGNIDDKTIVVEDGKAFLVDVDKEGRVTRRYMEVPEYFESGKKHAEKVEAAKRKYEMLKKHQVDQIRFIAFDEGFNQLDETAVAHLHDVANHYKQTYANQVTITAAKRNNNEELLQKMIDDVTFILQTLEVAKDDIEVVYKNDKGDETLQFVKVQSNLR